MLLASGDVYAGDGFDKGVVSVGGAVTEIVFALGVEDRLVAVDSTSQYPEPVQYLPNVGYLRQLAAEPILALNPSLVLALSEAGPPHALALIRQAGVPLLTVPHEPTPAGRRQVGTTGWPSGSNKAMDMQTEHNPGYANHPTQNPANSTYNVEEAFFARCGRGRI